LAKQSEDLFIREEGIYSSGMDYSRLTPLPVEAVKALKELSDGIQEEQTQKMHRLYLNKN